METKLKTSFFLITTLLLQQHLWLAIADHTSAFNTSSGGGLSLRLISSHEGSSYIHRRGSDGFLYLKHSLSDPSAKVTISPEDNDPEQAILTIGTGTAEHKYTLKLDATRPIFSPNGEHINSPSYRPLTPSDEFCKPENGMEPAGEQCAFHVSDAGGMSLAERGMTRFSNCLTRGTTRRGFLGFGTDVPHNSRYQTTRILPALDASEAAYYVDLVGISLGERRLDKIHPQMFARGEDGEGGSVIDLGTSVTLMAEEAYRVVEETMWSELKEHGAERVERRSCGLCSLSLHFAEEEEATLVVSPEQLFLMMVDEHPREIACLAVVPGRRTIIGVLQQVDMCFVFDMKDSKILFEPELCIKDTWTSQKPCLLKQATPLTAARRGSSHRHEGPSYSTRRGSDGFLYLKHSLNTSYILKVDATSRLTWIQCEPCVPHAPQQGPIYSPNGGHIYSKSYRPIAASNRPAEGRCVFHATGPGGMSAHGENFQNRGTYAGVAALGRAPALLTMQLAAHGMPRFSYCLTKGTSRYGFLRFGTDVPHNSRYQTTRILTALDASEAAYYVDIVSISLGQHRLDRIQPQMFARAKDGEGGSVIDLGTSVTVMAEEAYRVVEETMWSELKEHGAERVERRGYGLCFRVTESVKRNLQSLSLHFAEEEEATLVVSPEHLFLMTVDEHVGEIACLAMVPGHRTIIGALQQVDMRFVFDLKDSKILSAPELCIKDTRKLAPATTDGTFVVVVEAIVGHPGKDRWATLLLSSEVENSRSTRRV
ncbi:hypothetical protein HU200_026932 [Digitaria exilis]|uniref:Peptidase A1 domain-containing protein n=1 Tax=Digitaria exilis TaxID=1010633 RepID=A0A835BXK4_9POAL|nr:hypothetical protein HU200_026932 [Digitaria exilis]